MLCRLYLLVFRFAGMLVGLVWVRVLLLFVLSAIRTAIVAAIAVAVVTAQQQPVNEGQQNQTVNRTNNPYIIIQTISTTPNTGVSWSDSLRISHSSVEGESVTCVTIMLYCFNKAYNCVVANK